MDYGGMEILAEEANKIDIGQKYILQLGGRRIQKFPEGLINTAGKVGKFFLIDRPTGL